MKLLLDTHVFLWWFAEDARLPTAVRRELEAALQDECVHLSDISLWEIATMHSLGRIRLHLPLLEWLEKATAGPRVQLEPIRPAVAAAVAELPSQFQRDPADRIIVATALVLGARLATLDGRIRQSGLVPLVG